MVKVFEGTYGTATVRGTRAVKIATLASRKQALTLQYIHKIAQVALEGMTHAEQPVRVLQYEVAQAANVQTKRPVNPSQEPKKNWKRFDERNTRKTRGLVALVSKAVELEEKSAEYMQHRHSDRPKQNLDGSDIPKGAFTRIQAPNHSEFCPVCSQYRKRLPEEIIAPLEIKLENAGIEGGIWEGIWGEKTTDIRPSNIGITPEGRLILFEVAHDTASSIDPVGIK
ncbi:TPA: hypothetical protein HA244_02110 [Candidatus Micrarchaeota archaeon]|nr:hypothetical protein [Candidatus Micrarchaeota archaeon]